MSRVKRILFFCLISVLSACDQIGLQPVEITSPADASAFAGGAEIAFSARINCFEGQEQEAVWDFGDGFTSSGLSVVHAFNKKGTYTVALTVSNEYDQMATDAITVTITSYRFVKLDELAQALPDNATAWTSDRDTTTGLVWELKQNRDEVPDYANPHDADNTYTWYDNNTATNGGNAGVAGEGTDTQDIIAALNAAYYGSFADWRLPTCDELTTLRDPDRFNPAIDIDYFPNTVPWYYWTSTTYEDFTDSACHIYFLGEPPAADAVASVPALNHHGGKDLAYHVRAVSNGVPIRFWQGAERIYVKKNSLTAEVALEGLLVRTFKGKDAVLMSEVVEKAAIVDDPENYFYNFLATDNYSLEMALINNPVYGTGLPPWQDLQKGYLYQTGSENYGLMVGWEQDTIGGRIHNAYDVRLMDGGAIELRTEDMTYPDNG